MKGSQRSQCRISLGQRFRCGMPAAVAVAALAALPLSGCGDYKPPKFSEIVGSGDEKEEKKPATPVAQAPPQESPISPGSVPVDNTPEPQDAASVEPAEIKIEVAAADPEKVIADLEKKNFKIQTDSELKILAEGIGDRIDLVTKLDLTSSKVTPAGMEILGTFVHLKELNLANMSLTSDGWQPLENLTELERLNLYKSSINDDELAYLKGLVNLKDLSLQSCKRTTDQGHYHFEKLRNLERLDVSNNDKIKGGGIAHLEKRGTLGNLREFIANSTFVGQEGMGAIQGMKNLEVLEIGTVGLNNVGMGAFRKSSTKIRRLMIGGNQAVTDAGMVELKRLKQLEELEMPRLALVTDLGLSQIKGAKDLQYVNVDGTRVTRGGAQQLKKLIPKVKIKVSNNETIE